MNLACNSKVESVRQLIAILHRKNSKLVRSIAVFDDRHGNFYNLKLLP
ncbi:hypothetical protein OH492_04040 [Vibrio chagasii]|nr:hypothetical protein [Vibrio chagasii]